MEVFIKANEEDNAENLVMGGNKCGAASKRKDSLLISKGGKEIPIEDICAPIKDDDGAIIGVVLIFRDITERRRAEKELQNEREKLRILSENSPFGMALIDKDGTFRYINPKFKEIFGYDLKDIPFGREWFIKAYPDPAYRHEAISAWINDSKDAQLGEKRPRTFAVTCKNKTERSIKFVAVKLEDGGDLLTYEDITERKRVEEALQESEKKYRTIVENTFDIIYSCMIDGTIIFVTPNVSEWGYLPDEIVGHNLAEFIYPEDLESVLHDTQRTLQSGEVFPTTFRLLLKDGSYRYVEEIGNLWQRTGRSFNLQELFAISLSGNDSKKPCAKLKMS